VRAIRPAERESIRENCAHYVEVAREHVEQAEKMYR
jgi:hypothetical protein